MRNVKTGFGEVWQRGNRPLGQWTSEQWTHGQWTMSQWTLVQWDDVTMDDGTVGQLTND